MDKEMIVDLGGFYDWDWYCWRIGKMFSVGGG